MGADPRVGIRQWRALIALDTAATDGLSVRQARARCAGTDKTDGGFGVVDGLVAQRLARHACPCDDHPLGWECRVTITARGESARLDKRGRRVLSDRT